MPMFEFPTLDDVKACIRDSGHDWVMVSFNNESLCTDCARANFREVVKAMKGKGVYGSLWNPRKAYSAYDENYTEKCNHCGKFIGLAFEAYGPDYVHNAYTSMERALSELAYLIDLHYGGESREYLLAVELLQGMMESGRPDEFNVMGAKFGIRRINE